MRKISLALAMIAASFAVNAQKTSERANAFKVNLFSPLVKTGSFFYERKLNEKSTAQLGFGFTSYTPDDVSLKGIFLTPEYRFYLSGEAMNGFYVGPYVRYQNLKLEDKTPGSEGKATLNTFGGGLVVGRQWLFSDRITLDIFAGPNYSAGDVKVKSGDDNFDVPGTFKGFGVRTGVTLGIAF